METDGILEEGRDIGCRKAETQRINIEEGKLLQHTKGQVYNLP